MASLTSKTISLTSTKVVSSLLSIITGMILTRYLSKNEYGTFAQTFIMYDFLLPLISLGLPTSILYFFSNYFNQKKIVLEIFLILLFMSLLYSLFLYFGGIQILSKRFNNPLLIETSNLIIFYPIYTIPVLIGPAIWIYQNRIKFNTIFSILTNSILVIFIIITAAISQNYKYTIIAKLILPLFFFPVAVYNIFSKLGGNWVFPQFSTILPILKKTIPLSIASIVGTIAIQFSCFIVSLNSTTEDFAIYSIGAKEVPLISIITNSISIILLAEMTKKFKDNNIISALDLFKKSCYISSIFLFPAMFFLLLYAKPFLVILYSSKYFDSYLPFTFFLFLIPIRVINYSIIYIALGKSREMLFRSFVELLLTSILSFVFIKFFGIVGAPLGIVVASYFWSLPYNLIILSREFRCRILFLLPLKKLLMVLKISAYSLLVPLILINFEFNVYLKFFISSFFFVFSYGILLIKNDGDIFRRIENYFSKNNIIA